MRHLGDTEVRCKKTALHPTGMQQINWRVIGDLPLVACWGTQLLAAWGFIHLNSMD